MRLPGDTVDWEAELVVVIGRGGRHIPHRRRARARIAGYTVGQDLSERTVQWQGQPAQFSMGKSFEGFAPTGPVIVTLDEFADPDRLAISTTIVSPDGTETVVQDGNTDQLIFAVDDLVSRLSEGRSSCCPATSSSPALRSGVGAGHGPEAVPRRGGDPRHRDRGYRHDHPALRRGRRRMILVTAANGNQGRMLGARS